MRMRSLFAAALALLLGGPALAGDVRTTASVPITVSTASTVQVANPIAGSRVWLTSYVLVSSAAGTAQFVSGTGALCAGSQQPLSGVMTLAAGTVVPVGDGGASLLIGPAGAGVCIVATGGSVAFAGSAGFQQQP